jgi:hypothetical protein
MRIGDRQGIGVQFDHRAKLVPLSIQGIDAGDVELDEAARGIAAGRHRALQLLHRHLVELEGRCR